MRYLKPIYEFIMSYEYESFSNSYYFNDEFDNEFKVEFDKKCKDGVELIYRAKRGDIWSFDVINTNIYRVLKTVFNDILKDFINNNEWCKSISMKGLSKDLEREFVSKRTKIYNRFFKNNKIDGWELTSYGNSIYLKKI
jgi:hypothetical protein